MAYIAYDQLTLGTVNGIINNHLLNPEIALQMAGDTTEINQKVQQILNNVKTSTLRNCLDLYFKDVNPDIISEWQQLRSSDFHRYRGDRPNMDTLPLYGMFKGSHGYEWGPITTLGGGSGQGRFRPFTFFTTTPPVNGSDATATYWSIAQNGDRLIDVLARKLYVNRGTDATSPIVTTWDRANSSDTKNYIINPEVLVPAHEYLAIARCFELGIFASRGKYSKGEQSEFMFQGEEYWHKKFVSTLYGEFDDRGRTVVPGVLKLLQTDFSNSGDWGDFDRQQPGEVHYGIV